MKIAEYFEDRDRGILISEIVAVLVLGALTALSIVSAVRADRTVAAQTAIVESGSRTTGEAAWQGVKLNKLGRDTVALDYEANGEAYSGFYTMGKNDFKRFCGAGKALQTEVDVYYDTADPSSAAFEEQSMQQGQSRQEVSYAPVFSVFSFSSHGLWRY